MNRLLLLFFLVCTFSITGCFSGSVRLDKVVVPELEIKTEYILKDSIKLSGRQNINSLKVYNDKLYVLDAGSGKLFSGKLKALKSGGKFDDLFELEYQPELKGRNFLQDFALDSSKIIISNTYGEVFIKNLLDGKTSLRYFTSPDKVEIFKEVYIVSSRIKPLKIMSFNLESELFTELSFEDTESSKILTNHFFLLKDVDRRNDLFWVFSRSENSFYSVMKDFSHINREITLKEPDFYSSKKSSTGKPYFIHNHNLIEDIVIPVSTSESTFFYHYGKLEGEFISLKQIEDLKRENLDVSVSAFFEDFFYIYDYFTGEILIYQKLK